MIRTNNIKLPEVLTKNGFSQLDNEEDQIDKDELGHIIEYIEMWFDKTKSINRKRFSYSKKTYC